MKLAASEKNTILAVDDKIENLKVLIDYLEESGYDMMVAQSGEQMLENIERTIPDIILLDVLMPGIDGFETCRRLKNNEGIKDIPVIFMTALSETVDKVKGFEVGAVDYLTKPLQHEEVLARVKTHITIRRLQKQLKRQNDLLKQKNSQLLEVNATKDKFLSIIAHDLKSPFTTLLSYSSMLVDNIENFTSEDYKRGIYTINRSAARTYKLLEDLLCWAYSNEGRMEYKIEKIELSKIVNDNIALLMDRATQKSINLFSLIKDGIFINTDKNMISTILRNLLSNAIKFTSQNGVVKVYIETINDNIKITVSDTGTGISEENIKKIFRLDTYFRKSGSDNETGTGMGLILCKEFIDRLKGDIWVESELDKGSNFIFTIPIHAC